MNSKEKAFEWLFEQWKPLIYRTLSQNYVLGLERDDLEQELKLVLWECFARNNVQSFPTYLSKSIHNRVTDLYTESQRYYYPSTKLRCIGCKFATFTHLRECPECGGKRWRIAKGKLTMALTEEIPHYDREVGESYPEDIEKLVEQIVNGKKTGYKQKQKLREYFNGN